MSLHSFSGNKCDFPRFRHSYIALAQGSSSICGFNHGLLGFLLPPAEWLQLVFPSGHVPTAFVPVGHPGAEPVLGNGSNALAVSIHRTQWDQWKFTTQQYQTQQHDLFAFKTIFLAAIDAVSLRRLTDPTTGTMQLTIRDLDAFLLQHHGTLVVSDYTTLLAQLSMPYVLGTPLADLIQRHRDAHAIALAQAQPFPPVQTVHYLKAALHPCGRFENCLMVWQLAHPLVANQTFAGLVTAVEDFHDSIDNKATSSSLGYSASVSSTPLTLQLVTDLIAAAVSAAPPRPSTALVPANKSRVPSMSRPRIYYCWTHGMKQNHTSRECLHPAPGHDVHATATDTKGGRS